MITSKQELKEYLKADNAWYSPKSFKDKLVARFCRYPAYEITRYIKYLRKQEYYINTANKNHIKGILAICYEHKKNKLGMRLGIEIGPNCFGKGLNIYHGGNIVVNASVRAGENCSLHGGNCIGNNGKVDISPKLGNNVDIGFGAVLIGDIYIADNTVIGANALVNHSFELPNCVVAGVPARIVHQKQDSL